MCSREGQRPYDGSRCAVRSLAHPTMTIRSGRPLVNSFAQPISCALQQSRAQKTSKTALVQSYSRHVAVAQTPAMDEGCAP